MLVHLISTLFCLGICAINASPVTPSIKKYAGEVIPNSYIVKLKDGISPEQVVSSAFGTSKSINTFGGQGPNQVFNGFTAKLNDKELKRILASSDVEYVEEDGILYTSNISGLSARSPVSQTNAPWNLARLSQDTAATNPPFTYKYSSVAGAGVDIYILDTGVFVEHTEFSGRASWGATFGGYPNTDGNGHGTHIAGIAAGTTYGVAKLANVVAVKVLSDAGSGATTDIISGLSWVVQRARSTGRKSVVLLALGGSPSISLDNAVINVFNNGIPVVACFGQTNEISFHVLTFGCLQTVAGGSNTDAASSSPARVAQAITVAASTQNDSAASFSNFGSIIDLYAPGQNVISAWIGSPTATATLSGVSMAGAHVAGLVAYVLSLAGPIPPATVADDLITMSVKNVLTGVPAGTPNRLASNNVSRIGITI